MDIGQAKQRKGQFRQPCVFCVEGTGNSKEHVFSNWTSPIVGKLYASHHSFTSRLEHIDGMLVESPREEKVHKGDALSRKVKGICENCNNTWMSQIEQQASQIAGPLMELQSATLSLEDQAILARWVTLKALITELTKNLDHTFPSSVYEQFYRQRTPPPGARIYIGVFDARLHKTPFFRTLWSVREDRYTGQKEELYSCSLLAWKHLFFAHIWSARPDRPYEFPRSRSRYLELIEPRRRDVQFPCNRRIDDACVEAMVQSFSSWYPDSFQLFSIETDINYVKRTKK